MFNKELLHCFSQLETPFYYYDMELFHKSLKTLKKAAEKYAYLVHYALKANANNRILEIIRDYGFGADCVSGNEVQKAIEVGFPLEKIVFAGVGKNNHEINYAIDHAIFGFNCESIEEIEIINDWAAKKQKIVPFSLRLNPDIDAVTHNFLTTGLNDNKFGIPLFYLDEAIEKSLQLGNVKLIGLHFHIGFQITSMEPYILLCKRVNSIQYELFEKYGLELPHINLGGGLGINYEDPNQELIPDFDKLFATIHQHLIIRKNQQIHFELGRSVVGQFGSLISRVLYIKKGVNRQFAILDAGMSDLIRPALYGSYHKIENLSKQKKGIKKLTYDVVGPLCETSDSFNKDVDLPLTERDDLMAIRSAGAYGEIMVSQYNLRNKPIAVYSDELIKKKEINGSII